MKALSLYQPYASAIPAGAKGVETRCWATTYRGQFLIHAAARRETGELLNNGRMWNWLGALRSIGWRWNMGKTLDEVLPFGALIGVATLTQCKRTEDFTVGELDTKRMPEDETSDKYSWTERDMGDFRPGRYGFVLADVKRFVTPLPWKGAQRFFEVPDDVVAPLIATAVPAFKPKTIAAPDPYPLIGARHDPNRSDMMNYWSGD